MTTKHREQNNPATPYIYKHWVVWTFGLNHFRCSIARRPAKSLKLILLIIKRAKPEVNDLDLSIGIYKDIFWFEISMGNFILMKVLNSLYYLLEIGAGLILGEPKWKRAYFFYFIIWRKSYPFGRNYVTKSRLFSV